jgi:hypothetical protein
VGPLDTKRSYAGGTGGTANGSTFLQAASALPYELIPENSTMPMLILTATGALPTNKARRDWIANFTRCSSKFDRKGHG